MRIVNDTLTDQTGLTANDTGDAVEVSHLYGYSVQVTTSDTGTGTLHIDKSNDGTNFISETSVAVPGGASTLFIDETDIFYKYIRWRYVHSAGTTNLKVIYNAKGF